MDIKKKGVMRAARFVLTPLSDEIFEGFTMGERFDGWACPYFTYEEGRRILRIYNEPIFITGKFNTGFYDLTTDAFVFSDENEPQIYQAVIENGQKYYQIGAWDWIWREVRSEKM